MIILKLFVVILFSLPQTNLEMAKKMKESLQGKFGEMFSYSKEWDSSSSSSGLCDAWNFVATLRWLQLVPPN